MKKVVISQVVVCGVTLLGLSSCASNGGVNQEKVDDSMHRVGNTFNQAVEKTNDSMKQLGPRWQAAKQKLAEMGPALDNAEHQARGAGQGLAKFGTQLGNAIDNTAKGLKQDLSKHSSAQPNTKAPAHK